MSTTVSSFSLSRIGQIAVNVHDVQRAVAFYRDVLNMRLLFEIPPKMAFFDCGGVRFMLSLPESAEYDRPGSIIYYAVGDTQEAARELKARGVLLDGEPHIVGRLPQADIWMAFFKDLDRNVLAVMSEVPR